MVSFSDNALQYVGHMQTRGYYQTIYKPVPDSKIPSYMSGHSRAWLHQAQE